MFESNRSPILIVDGDGVRRRVERLRGPGVRPAPVWRHAFGRIGGRPGSGSAPPGGRRRGRGRRPGAHPAAVDEAAPRGRAPRRVTAAHGSSRTSRGRAGGQVDPTSRVRPLTFEVDGRQVLYRPTSTLVGAPGADRRMQVIFEDVTAETRRHDLMEAYAGQVVLGQEEERRHIAQELHDGPLQTLIHLCRQIDALEARRGNGRRGPGRVPLDRDADAGLDALRPSRTRSPSSARSPAGCVPRSSTTSAWWPRINQVVHRRHRASGVRELVRRRRDGRPASARPSSSPCSAIAQEAVTNVERHAAARSAGRGAASSATTGSALTVEDDGAGFDATVRAAGTAVARSSRHERTGPAGRGAPDTSGPGIGTGTTVDVRAAPRRPRRAPPDTAGRRRPARPGCARRDDRSGPATGGVGRATVTQPT